MNFIYYVQKNDCDYKRVVELMLKNKWINPMHTNVPGPDGQLSYGGYCFPKRYKCIVTTYENKRLSTQCFRSMCK